MASVLRKLDKQVPFENNNKLAIQIKNRLLVNRTNQVVTNEIGVPALKLISSDRNIFQGMENRNLFLKEKHSPIVPNVQ